MGETLGDIAARSPSGERAEVMKHLDRNPLLGGVCATCGEAAPGYSDACDSCLATKFTYEEYEERRRNRRNLALFAVGAVLGLIAFEVASHQGWIR